MFPNNNRRPFAHILAVARFGKIRQYGYIDSLTLTSPRSKYDQIGWEDYPGTSLISALITLGYAVYLVWDQKQAWQGLKLVTYTSLWLILFVISIIVVAT